MFRGCDKLKTEDLMDRKYQFCEIRCLGSNYKAQEKSKQEKEHSCWRKDKNEKGKRKRMGLKGGGKCK